jgi:hypothetical protein
MTGRASLFLKAKIVDKYHIVGGQYDVNAGKTVDDILGPTAVKPSLSSTVPNLK